jgi:DNA-binding transcriptional LysR family regulator
MLDGITLDQLRTFIAAADEGSFSAAARRLRRAQSVVSKTLANMEGRLGVELFDRSARRPVLTEQGRALLNTARTVAGDMDLFKARAKGLAGGLEAELPVVVDAMFPIALLTDAVAAFQRNFPTTALKIYVEQANSVVELVRQGRCTVGVMAQLPLTPAVPQFTYERLLTIRIAVVVSPTHPLAAHRGPIPTTVLAEHVQLLQVERADLPSGLGAIVLSPKVWLLAHLGAKLAFLRAGFGFGGLPLHLVAADLASGALVRIAPEESLVWNSAIPLSAVYRSDNPPGPAARWLMQQLKQEEAWRVKEKSFLAAAPLGASVAPQRLRRNKRAHKPEVRRH